MNKVPNELIPKNIEDLERMLQEADKDIENGNTVSFDEVKAELDELIIKDDEDFIKK
jgi:hypothetical protein